MWRAVAVPVGKGAMVRNERKRDLVRRDQRASGKGVAFAFVAICWRFEVNRRVSSAAAEMKSNHGVGGAGWEGHARGGDRGL